MIQGNRKTTLLLGTAALGLLAGAVWSCSFMAGGAAAARSAAQDFGDCQSMAARIESVSRLPAMARERERVSDEMTGLIERAAKSAGIGTDRIVRISPEQPQRLADSAYKEKPTSVLLRNVTLQQVVALVHDLTSNDEALWAKSVRITAPSPEDAGQDWTAELVITYLIYDPVHSES